MSWDEVMLNSEEIEPITLVVIELQDISQSDSQPVEKSVK